MAKSGRTPDELKQDWSEYDFRCYAVYRAHEPSLEERLDFWGAQLVAVGLNPWRKKGARPVNPAHLIPDRWKPKPRERSAADWKNLLRGMAAAFNRKR